MRSIKRASVILRRELEAALLDRDEEIGERERVRRLVLEAETFAILAARLRVKPAGAPQLVRSAFLEQYPH